MKLIKYLLYFIADILLCTILFIILCRYIKVGTLSILFYRGCFFVLLCGIISSLFFYFVGKAKLIEVDWKDYIVACIFFIGFTLTWFILGPVTVERSISVYMLSYMDQNSEMPMNSDDMGAVFEKQYIGGFGAFDKRFNEQISSGNIEKMDKGYVITPRGKQVVHFFRILASVFDTEKWLVYPNDY